MATRKAKAKAAPKKAARARTTPRTSATKALAPQAANAPADAIEVKPPGTVEVNGNVTIRHYAEGKHSKLEHVTEDAAQEYADSVRGGA